MAARSRPEPSAQRSFRLSTRTLALLDQSALELSESRNGLAQRVLDEGLHTLRHPLVHFRQAAGGRRAALVATRLYVWQVIATLRENENSIDGAAGYLGISPEQVRAAVGYYGDFQDEVDADAASAAEFERAEQERWQRAQRVLG